VAPYKVFLIIGLGVAVALPLVGCDSDMDGNVASGEDQIPASASVAATNPLIVEWVKCGSGYKDVGAGDIQTTFALKTNLSLVKWVPNTTTWQSTNGSGLAVDVGPSAVPWLIGTDKKVYYGTYPNSSNTYFWERLDWQPAMDIGISSQFYVPPYTYGEPWGIVPAYPQDNPKQCLRWNWPTLSWWWTGNEEATKVDVGPNGNAWKVGLDGKVWEGVRNGTDFTWILRSGMLATDIGVSSHGDVWITSFNEEYPSHDKGVYRWNAASNAWERSNGGGIRISVDDVGRPWLVNSIGDIYRSNSVSHI
jgi:hypothetical protein